MGGEWWCSRRLLLLLPLPSALTLLRQPLLPRPCRSSALPPPTSMTHVTHHPQRQ